MNYMDMMRKQDSSRLAFVEEGREFSYGQLVTLAERMSRNADVFSSVPASGRIHWIHKNKISEQLIEFMAANERGEIPVIVPEDRAVGSRDVEVATNLQSAMSDQESGLWDAKICMGVMTSGSTGEPKVLFRSYESWADYFDTQNQIFAINQDSRLFAQGSLAFTGNLNMYLAAFYTGAAVIAQNAFQPREWENLMKRYQVNAIYLIPSKLMCIPRVLQGDLPAVRTIVSGSQGMNRTDADQLNKVFPGARITLYYGASELSYISYITGEEMTEDRGLVGRPFPNVQIEVRDQQIYVMTPCCVAGVKCPFTVSDQGYLDEMGRLHFTGRSDDIVNVHGRKVSLLRIENVLMGQPGIQSAVVLHLPGQKIRHKQQGSETGRIRVAFVVLQNQMQMDSAFLKRLRHNLAGYEMPGRFVVLPEIPYRENGKVDREKLREIYEAL